MSRNVFDELDAASLAARMHNTSENRRNMFFKQKGQVLMGLNWSTE